MEIVVTCAVVLFTIWIRIGWHIKIIARTPAALVVIETIYTYMRQFINQMVLILNELHS